MNNFCFLCGKVFPMPDDAETVQEPATGDMVTISQHCFVDLGKKEAKT